MPPPPTQQTYLVEVLTRLDIVTTSKTYVVRAANVQAARAAARAAATTELGPNHRVWPIGRVEPQGDHQPMSPHALITSHIHPPIPTRHHDWCAYFDGDAESPAKYGWGPTKAAALSNLADTLVDALLEERDRIETQLAEARAPLDHPTWTQESTIARLQAALDAIEAKIDILDTAIEAASKAEAEAGEVT
jgi:hypothetical protein